MAEAAKKKEASHWWWFESHNSSATAPKRSPWLQSTLADLDEKTKAMLRIIEEDADSFAKRAEMYYRKRPELITMIEEFYRAHRSLAERYELLKSESGPHHRHITTPWASPVPFKYPRVKSMTFTEKSYDSFSENNYDHMEEDGESEVDDPEVDEEEEVEDPIHPSPNTEKEEEVESSEVVNREVMKLREEIKRLKEENMNQKQQLEEKDEEKREVIRQLSVAMDVLKEENVKLKKHIAKETPKKSAKSPTSPSEFHKLKGMFLGKLFSGSPNSKASVIAL